MTIAWISPFSERCGIADYSRQYVEALRKRCDVACFEPTDFRGRSSAAFASMNRCDLVHVQYESSFFSRGNGEYYGSLCRGCARPLIASLHEVYRSFPGVFPREQLSGSGVTLRLRQWLYDRRHPLQTAYLRHAASSFYATTVLVHYEFQAALAAGQGVDPEKIEILPHPLPRIAVPAGSAVREAGTHPPLCLAGLGFVNPHFDYRLLLAALDRLRSPWRFVWIGGPRRREDEEIAAGLNALINGRGWQDRFTITGWVDEDERNRLLLEADMVLALFSARSSSGSLATALGALRPVVATSLPLTEELAAKAGALHIVDSDAAAVAAGIERIAGDERLRSGMVANAAAYRDAVCYEAMAARLIDLYKGRSLQERPRQRRIG